MGSRSSSSNSSTSSSNSSTSSSDSDEAARSIFRDIAQSTVHALERERVSPGTARKSREESTPSRQRLSSTSHSKIAEALVHMIDESLEFEKVWTEKDAPHTDRGNKEQSNNDPDAVIQLFRRGPCVSSDILERQSGQEKEKKQLSRRQVAIDVLPPHRRVDVGEVFAQERDDEGKLAGVIVPGKMLMADLNYYRARDTKMKRLNKKMTTAGKLGQKQCLGIVVEPVKSKARLRAMKKAATRVT
jgi:hypothetical protein